MRKMKNKQKLVFGSLFAMITVMLCLPMVSAITAKVGVDIGTGTQDAEVYVSSDVDVDDLLGNLPRRENYAFFGEEITWRALVVDGNGEDDIGEVSVEIDGAKEETCTPLAWGAADIEPQWGVDWDGDYMNWYECVYPIGSAETDGIEGDLDVVIRARNDHGADGVSNPMLWWFNPMVGLDVPGGIVIPDLVEGTTIYSGEFTVVNDVEPDSGVLLDMSIYRSEFTADSITAECPNDNVMETNFWYRAERSGVNQDWTMIPTGEGNSVPIFQTLDPDDNVLGEGLEIDMEIGVDVPDTCTPGVMWTGGLFFVGEVA